MWLGERRNALSHTSELLCPGTFDPERRTGTNKTSQCWLVRTAMLTLSAKAHRCEASRRCEGFLRTVLDVEGWPDRFVKRPAQRRRSLRPQPKRQDLMSAIFETRSLRRIPPGDHQEDAKRAPSATRWGSESRRPTPGSARVNSVTRVADRGGNTVSGPRPSP